MNKQSSMNLKVGIFVLVAIFVFLIGIFTISGDSTLFAKKYIIKTSFENTSGLLPGAYVRLSGVQIGAIKTINFPQNNESNSIEVIMEVNENGFDRITPDSTAKINTEGLLGAKYIEIQRGVNFSAKMKEGGYLEGQAPFEIQEIVDQSKELLTNIVKISDNMNNIIETFSDETNLAKFEETLSSVKESSESFKEILKGIETEKGTLNALIYDVEFKNNIKSSLKSFNELSNLLSEAGEKINEGKSFEDITETIKNIREITEALNGGEGTLGALLIDPSVHDSLKGVLGEAERSKFVRAAVKYMLEEKKEENKKE